MDILICWLNIYDFFALEEQPLWSGFSHLRNFSLSCFSPDFSISFQVHCELTLPIPKVTLLANVKFANGKKLTIIERGCAIEISRFVSGEKISYLLRQIDLRDNDKSWCLAITEFNNSFIIQSTKAVKPPSASLGNRFTIFTQERGLNYAWAEYHLQENSYLKAVICRAIKWQAFNQWKGRKNIWNVKTFLKK